MREFVYLLAASDYQFSNGFQHFIFKFLYELRKDVWVFCFFVAMIGVYRYVVAQWLGDAHSISNKPDKQIDNQQSAVIASILLVKKLGKEFLVKTKNIEWAEAYGNYANLHINNEIYPMRTTMSDFILKSRHHGLISVHRSFAVSLNKVHFIEPLVSGDAKIVMQSGEKIRLSRRYKIDLEILVANH